MKAPRTFIRVFAAVLLIAGWAAESHAEPPAAPLARLHVPETVHTGQQVQAFVEIGARQPVESVRVHLPPGWQLLGASAARDGGRSVMLEVSEARAGMADARFAEPVRGPLTVALRLRVGPDRGHGRVGVVARSGWADLGIPLAATVLIRDPLPARNPAFQLSPDAAPVQIRRRALPSLDPRDPLTVEFWLKTTGLREVVLSTWDGDDARPYPLEIETDVQGRLVVYRGRSGLHEGLASRVPVADGTWRHVAFVHDPEDGWSRLMIDGVVSDSGRVRDSGAFNTMPLALGGRPMRPGASDDRRFSGVLDELRLWPRARRPAAVTRTMRTPIEAPPAGVFRLGFDEAIPDDLLVRPASGTTRVNGDLVFGAPVESFEAQFEGGAVQLSWLSRDPAVVGFELERSQDGQHFTRLASIPGDESLSTRVDGARQYGWTDSPPAGQVVYYRLRQVDGSADAPVAAGLKLGLGATAADDEAVLAIRGNSPNPFRSHTSILVEIPRQAHVALTVWDISGTRVAVVFEGELSEGRHAIRFSATDLPSGVYFVRLETPYGTAAHRMTRTN